MKITNNLRILKPQKQFNYINLEIKNTKIINHKLKEK